MAKRTASDKEREAVKTSLTTEDGKPLYFIGPIYHQYLDTSGYLIHWKSYPATGKISRKYRRYVGSLFG